MIIEQATLWIFTQEGLHPPEVDAPETQSRKLKTEFRTDEAARL